MLFVLSSLLPALLAPLRFVGKPGWLRRVLWCWLLPVAPVLFVWDGIVICLRMWDDEQWRQALGQVQQADGGQMSSTVSSGWFIQSVSLCPASGRGRGG